MQLLLMTEIFSANSVKTFRLNNIVMYVSVKYHFLRWFRELIVYELTLLNNTLKFFTHTPYWQ